MRRLVRQALEAAQVTSRERSARVRELPCVACSKRGHPQPSRSEEHHLNLGGKAGQKRRGPEFTIPLCGWHHRGNQNSKMSSWTMTAIYGPSLAAQSKMFRAIYGSDDELLEITNRMIGSRS